QFAGAMFHLFGGLVGEGYRQDPTRLDPALDQLDDAKRNHTRLARPRTRQHQQRSREGMNSLVLMRIQASHGTRLCTESVENREGAFHERPRLPVPDEQLVSSNYTEIHRCYKVGQLVSRSARATVGHA